ncbi:hypothetical protein GQ602_005140 [Ophiocordyceps camponoti-floridani]|uniref:Uncharacterized protein n=1 Tax=Ophiocordyceps camponoti-floridani TaxID=2030778 RepID=A0A8H4Q5M0_9HYPO|nr:hypothetical protein GQ602_005140 [Ophiocordyceps camponoti-floridani]
MTSSDHSSRRFAPVPIETIFQSVRRPESSSPTNPDLRRRFHPQLIETSRRAHRTGDDCPATRPTDKTDITPYTNHIYLQRPRGRCTSHDARHMRRETEDDGVKAYLLRLTAIDAARQMQEDAALAAFPNSRAREGGVAHFYFGDSSGSDRPRSRRKSSDLGLNWWHSHMQEHAQLIARCRPDVTTQGRDTFMTTDSDLDNMDLALPPDPLWTTNGRTAVDEHLPAPDLGPPKPTPLANDTASLAALYGGRGPGSGRPFGPLGLQPDKADLLLLRKTATPPMLGKDLTFRKCPSPKPTGLETDRPFASRPPRDVSGRVGLWRGYCCRSTSPGSPPASAKCETSSTGLWTAGISSSSSSSGKSSSRDKRGTTKHTEKVLREFDDAFVTQVYDYLSLGHPVTARPFDEELSRISKMTTDELTSLDDEARRHHIVRDPAVDPSRCPRWRALKLYIVEWARQHPDLENLDPLSWGVGERRGSWAF